MHSNRTKKIKYRIDKNGCYICISHSCTTPGYPQIQRNKKKQTVIRLLYKRKYGKIKKGLVIRHDCDNKKCINLTHVRLGTITDNNNDRNERGRCAIGEKHGISKLTEKDVDYIRKRKDTIQSLGKKFHVSTSTITDVLYRKTWTHV